MVGDSSTEVSSKGGAMTADEFNALLAFECMLFPSMKLVCVFLNSFLRFKDMKNTINSKYNAHANHSHPHLQVCFHYNA